MRGRSALTLGLVALLIAACGAPTLRPSSTARPSPGPSSRPSAPASSDRSGVASSFGPLPSIATSAWLAQTMPYLGYALDLPLSWERVGNDPQKPVPSIATIESLDPKTAQDLQAVAQGMADGGGLFDALGLWSVDPRSLLQLGLLAGSPYRVAAGELEAGVEESVAGRASLMAQPSITPISMPAGDGYLAVYLDASDLSEHREVHLRTPVGRYLILATTYPGLADPELAATVLAVARSIRPLSGEASGERPAPSMAADGRDPGFEAELPASVGGVTLTRRSLNGEALVGSDVAAAGSIAGELGRLVSTPGDVTVALALPSVAEVPVLVAGYRFAGVGAGRVQDFLATFPPQLWSSATVGGKEVLASVAGSDGSRTYLRVGGAADGEAGGAADGELFQVQTSDATLAEDALRQLP